MGARPGILAPTPPRARSLTFRLESGGDAKAAWTRFTEGFDVGGGVVGVGAPLAAALGLDLPGLRSFPSLPKVVSTQSALWVLLRADDSTRLFDETARVAGLLAGGLVLDDAMELFTYAGGRDLTGYEDGTENPKDEKASAAALRPDGSSFVAVQRWSHDLKRFRSLSRPTQDDVVGRRRETNEEFAEAPPTAHVKRAAQESFDPAAFMVRRSMPWMTGLGEGLEFIAYGKSLDRYERVLRRMVGLEDGQVDALFSFSVPVTGGYFWCPPVDGQRLAVGRVL